MSLQLKNREWKDYLISEEFILKNSKAYHKLDLKESNLNGISYVSRTNSNNGVESIVKKVDIESNKANTIVFGAENATFFYQPNEYITGNKMYYIGHKKLNKYSGLFIQQSLNSSIENCGFGYGKGLIGTRVKKRYISLPVNSIGEPDFQFMEAFIKQKEQEKIENYNTFIAQRFEDLKDYKTVKPIEQKSWYEFEIGKLFTLSSGKSKGLNHLVKSKLGVNYLGATNLNNGVLCQVKKNKEMIHKGNCIAFIRNGEGSMGYSIYKYEDFIATSDISVGYNKNLNRSIGMFITTVADKVRGKYNFGYKRSNTRLKKEKILLPVNNENKPDYEYMENYMK